MTTDEYRAKAKQALRSANILLASGDTDGACNRAYYAAFHSAHAALSHRLGQAYNPAETRTHAGLIRHFGLELVKTGEITADVGKIINRIEQLRLLADYTGSEIEQQDVENAIEKAEYLLSAVDRYVSSAS